MLDLVLDVIDIWVEEDLCINLVFMFVVMLWYLMIDFVDCLMELFDFNEFDVIIEVSNCILDEVVKCIVILCCYIIIVCDIW